MPLEVRPREVENILILDLHGRLVAGPEVMELRRTMAALPGEGKINAILNLRYVDYIDSTGLGTLVIGHASLKKAGGAMKLLHASRRSVELMVITKLSTVFEMFDDEQAAVNSFFADREVPKFDILEFVKSEQNEPQHLGADEPGAEPKPSEA